ncbi:DNA processing protein [Parvibaculum indicum]|uniref:DNA-processing protein DprA n=1 Tax=Parvibaculum indicum TaxID=562969 RepID=UPI00142070DE|nr:DNA-processing protein DprA [Parvibaculum indicum]NIJ40037.1 DNA processing protein [Parvibaculum indicum]
MIPLPQEERLARLRLARSENIGPVTFRDLLEHFGSAETALEALPDLAARGGRKRNIRVASVGDAEREMAALEKLGATLLVLGDADYPPPLALTDPPPPVIAVKGKLSLLTRDTIAMVGSRNASAAGRRIAGDIAKGLSERGYVVASGLARGIDTAAHQASLASGTIAVVAGGLDIFYPPENEKLQRIIGEEGLLMGEMPLGTSPQARHFPRRNRLISGLSLATVVVEAALRSGSLITARYALEQNRDVCAVPGSPLDPRAHGANRLIKQGATLVETAEDVVDALGAPHQAHRRLAEPRHVAFSQPVPSAEPDDAIRLRVLEALGPTPTPLGDLLNEADAAPGSVRAVLIELELAGRLQRDPGDRLSLIPEAHRSR